MALEFVSAPAAKEFIITKAGGDFVILTVSGDEIAKAVSVRLFDTDREAELTRACQLEIFDALGQLVIIDRSENGVRVAVLQFLNDDIIRKHRVAVAAVAACERILV